MNSPAHLQIGNRQSEIDNGCVIVPLAVNVSV
jgi:hypothetical protein